MTHEWTLPTASNSGTMDHVRSWEIGEELLYYNGPQLVTMRDQMDQRLYLVLAVEDMSPSVTRWLAARISRGQDVNAKPLRDFFTEPDTVIVVDFDATKDGGPLGEPVSAWEVPGWDIPDAVLPRPGARLPL